MAESLTHKIIRPRYVDKTFPARAKAKGGGLASFLRRKWGVQQ